MSHTKKGLRLVRERKLADLLSRSRGGGVFEASGVVAQGGHYLVVFDNIRRIARIAADLAPGSGHSWVGRLRQGEGYEDIAFSPEMQRFYALIEAEKHPDGTYKAIVEEYNSEFSYQTRARVNVRFDKRNRGFEGLAAVRRDGEDFLLALCEGNDGRSGARGKMPGGGLIHVIQKHGHAWDSVAEIHLPTSLDFKDYSALAVRGERVVVVSQKSARLWTGKLSLKNWTISGEGPTYEFPRSEKGKRLYCTVEGVDWISDNSFVMVSDKCKKGYPDRCGRTDQSIHIFRFSGARTAKS